MANSVLHKSSSTAGVVPAAASLTSRELALNTADGRLFTKKDSGSVVEFAQTAPIKAQYNITGGGIVAVDGSGNVSWSVRFIVISNGNGTHFSTVGYFDINMPTSGTITGVGGAANVTATAAGIPLNAWQALYYILPIGSNSTSVAANFRVASYGAALVVPDTWVLICIRNGDNGRFYFPNGYSLQLSQSLNTYTYSTRYAQDSALVSGKGVGTSGNALALLDGTNTWSGSQSFSTAIASTVATGTAPLTVSSTTGVTNLNADMVDGLHSTSLVYGNNSGSNTAPVTWSGTHLTQYKSGFFDVTGASWMPDTGWWWCINTAHTSNSSSYLYGGQIAIQENGNPKVYVRIVSGGATPAAGAWQQVWHEGSDGSGSGLDADLLDGQHGSYYAPINNPTFTGIPRLSTGFSVGADNDVYLYEGSPNVLNIRTGASGSYKYFTFSDAGDFSCPRYMFATYFNMSGAADATAATEYFFGYGDGFIRRKTLANVKAEIVTSAAIVAGLGYTPSNPGGLTVSVISTNTTATAGTTYCLTASLTLTLPATPAAGAMVTILNRSGVATCIVARNGSNIMALAQDLTLDLSASFSLVYTDATNGWVIL